MYDLRKLEILFELSQIGPPAQVADTLGQSRSVFAAVRESSMHNPTIRLVLNELKSAKRTK